MSGSNAIDRLPSVMNWPGDRVETRALFMPSARASSSRLVDDAPPSEPPPSQIEHVFIPALASEPFVSASELWGAMQAVGVITAGVAVLTPIVALLFFR